MVLASISFRARPHKRSEILSAVDDAVERMRQTAGCERCRLLVDTEDQNAFTVMSEWQTTGEADAYFNSREFRIFRGIRILSGKSPSSCSTRFNPDSRCRFPGVRGIPEAGFPLALLARPGDAELGHAAAQGLASSPMLPRHHQIPRFASSSR